MAAERIRLHIPFISGGEQNYIADVLANPQGFSQRKYLKNCLQWLKENYTELPVLLTNTCTSALEIVCLSEGFQPGDEVIMPSFTYVSTANAFVRQGVIPVFIDINATDLNLDVSQLEAAITPKTKAIVAVHYAGVACNMHQLLAISKKHNLLLIEDAAHSFGAKYQNQLLGTIGHYGVISFDLTKNIHCGQGGMLLANRPEKLDAIHITYENGTNRDEFLSDKVPYFEWKACGSKFLLSDLSAAFLLAQLQASGQYLENRKHLWNLYHQTLSAYNNPNFTLPNPPGYANHNGHVFYIKLNGRQKRDAMQKWLLQHNIESSFHFIPLHSSSFGRKTGRFVGEDINTTSQSNNLLRLPLHYLLTEADIIRVADAINAFQP